jgi:hypothetical protein
MISILSAAGYLIQGRPHLLPAGGACTAEWRYYAFFKQTVLKSDLDQGFFELARLDTQTLTSSEPTSR